MTWRHMKQFCQDRFLPPDYQQTFCNQFEYCKQGTMIVAYGGVISPFITMRSIHDGRTTSSKVHQRFKIPHPIMPDLSWRVLCWWRPQQGHEDEKLQSRALPFRYSVPIEERTTDAGAQSSPTKVDQPPVRQSTNTSASAPPPTTSQLQRARRSHTSSLTLASVIGVKSLNIGPMNT